MTGILRSLEVGDEEEKRHENNEEWFENKNDEEVVHEGERKGYENDMDEDGDDHEESKESKDDSEADAVSQLDHGGKRRASSKYAGVHRSKNNELDPWRAQISIDGKIQSLGNYATEKEAARAFDAEGARLKQELNLLEEWEKDELIDEKEDDESLEREAAR